ncbi:MAG: ERF family protein [Verrucomicrobia bacterium]|nr:ERF family protein [Verrucomicrobiota bacterium]
MKPSATASSSRKSPVRRSVTRALHALFAPRSPQTPSHPDASPRSDRFRCGGRESNFLAATIPVTKPDAHGLGSALTYGRRYSVSALLAISADEDDDANGAVTPQESFRRGPQGNIVIDEPVRPAPGRPLGGNR